MEKKEGGRKVEGGVEGEKKGGRDGEGGREEGRKRKNVRDCWKET